MRRVVWPYLLGHYKFGDTAHQRLQADKRAHDEYALALETLKECEEKGENGDLYAGTDLAFATQV